MNIVAHNIHAMNANRQLNIVLENHQETSRKLASGYRINQSSDDAAGLSISEKMRKQIRGLSRGQRNTQEGIELCKIADGALAEVSDMLQRMSELSIQAANGTASNSDRGNIQDEIREIIGEIDRISNSTTYNHSIYLLKEPTMDGIYNQLDVNYSPTLGTNSISFTNDTNADIMFDGQTYSPGDTISAGFLEYYNQDTGEYSVVFRGIDTIIKPVASQNVSEFQDYQNKLISFLKNAIGNGAGIGSLSTSDLYYDNKGNVFYRNPTVIQNPDGSHSTTYSNTYLATTGKNGKGNLVTRGNSLLKDVSYVHADVTTKRVGGDIGFLANGIWIQSGANSSDGMILKFEAMNATILGVNNLDVSTVAGAQDAMGRTANAIEALSIQRSLIGAQQNRLEHTVKNTGNIIENTTGSESRIRDADMAEEMVRYSTSGILMQAGQAILAQMNQSNQSVLNLLSG